eukprot:TRINITY_DN33_c0_g1_i1.p3 TRINITY_DN33_c0_g1~~TRINITY_DN33_c0_g1_i1.p3  ORF type:complete len:138 (-),score=29.86 TRINITY_DN33_c0_g1_i1:1362-1745(-)
MQDLCEIISLATQLRKLDLTIYKPLCSASFVQLTSTLARLAHLRELELDVNYSGQPLFDVVDDKLDDALVAGVDVLSTSVSLCEVRIGVTPYAKEIFDKLQEIVAVWRVFHMPMSQQTGFAMIEEVE